MAPIIECVPNFSEGRDPEVIRQITDQVETVEGVRLLDVDPGAATNRTVVTFAGPPEAVIESAFRAIARANQLIDMSKHKGEHPRFGACDVCPLIPIGDITMEETVEWARKLAKRLGDELGMSIYCYESAATSPQRKNLATVRAGEYEGLPEKLAKPEWKPDFGPAKFNVRSGATAVGARDFLVAYNVNLNTTSVRRANSVAFDLREAGRVTGKDDDGNSIREPGLLKGVKAIGWFIQEYGVAQISMNITDIQATPVHEAFEAAFERAEARGLRATGSELVGLIPLKSMLEAGKFYLRRQRRSLGVPDRELVRIAIKSMGLDELAPFDPDKKIIEYVLAAGQPKQLVDLSVTGFAQETASESPAPGGGSISASLGAFGSALGTMVANLSSHKKSNDDRWEEFSHVAEHGKACMDELLFLVDEDTRSFNMIGAAAKLPKGTPEEIEARDQAMQAATLHAISVPFRVMEVALDSMQVLKAMGDWGLAASASDVGVGALCARSAVMGAFMNVRINAPGLEDKAKVEDFLKRGKEIQAKAQALETEILELVEKNL